jgi:hypothetical protein
MISETLSARYRIYLLIHAALVDNLLKLGFCLTVIL